MTFIFWQNVISIHQSAFIKALSARHRVILVAEAELDSQRAAEGWDVPSMGQATVFIAPDSQKINELLDIPDAHHIFSGIDAFPMLYRTFREAVARGLDISVFAEPYDWRGVKGWLRGLKYRLLFLRYGRHIRLLFTTGLRGQQCYRKSGFPAARIRQFGYFTERRNSTSLDSSTHNSSTHPTHTSSALLPEIIFIGKLDQRKNVLALIDAAKECEGQYKRLRIIGAGPLEQQMAESIKGHPVEYLGTVPNRLVNGYISEADLLVLPSLFDGWGAVVNEALMAGTRVLCSGNCGAAALLDGEERGGTFDVAKEGDLTAQLRGWLAKGCLQPSQRLAISQWADRNISGDAVASYFETCVSTPSNVTAPWITPP